MSGLLHSQVCLIIFLECQEPDGSARQAARCKTAIPGPIRNLSPSFFSAPYSLTPQHFHWFLRTCLDSEYESHNTFLKPAPSPQPSNSGFHHPEQPLLPSSSLSVPLASIRSYLRGAGERWTREKRRPTCFFHTSTLEQWFSKQSSTNFDITCELVRNANSLSHSSPTTLETLRAGAGKEFQQALQVILKLTQARRLSANYLRLRPASVPYPPEGSPLHGLGRQGMTQCWLTVVKDSGPASPASRGESMRLGLPRASAALPAAPARRACLPGPGLRTCRVRGPGARASPAAPDIHIPNPRQTPGKGPKLPPRRPPAGRGPVRRSRGAQGCGSPSETRHLRLQAPAPTRRRLPRARHRDAGAVRSVGLF